MSFRRTVRRAVGALARVGLDVSGVPVTESDTGGFVGIYYSLEQRIEIRPGLRGAELWRVILHEYGHHLGLDHKKRGIMSARQGARADFVTAEPSRAQVKRWTVEIARLVLAERVRQWRV